MLSLLRMFGRAGKKTSRPKPAKSKRGRRVPRRFGYESLEGRVLLAVVTVDDDGAQKPNADYTTISAAVAAASPGDTIRVYRGTYNESVQVDKTLNIQGQARKAVVQPPAGLTGFSLLANNIVVQGFTVEDATGNAGIYTSPAFSGYKVINNLIRDNTIGLYLNSSGARTSFVKLNTFQDNNVPGAAAGNGIYADQGTQNVRIEVNSFRGHENAGILFANAGTVQNDIRISHNRSVDDATFVALFNADDVRIEHNVILDTTTADDALQGSKIFVGGDSNGVLVKGNLIRGGAFDGVAVRDTLGAPGGTSDVRVIGNVIQGVANDGVSITAAAAGAAQVIGNHITSVGRHGILLSGATEIDVIANYIQRSGEDGISLENAQDNLIRGNLSLRNGRDGIRADVLSAGNLIRDNLMQRNGEHDCHDDSIGAGTAGTANTWLRNHGRTENRPGLCRR